MTKSFNQVSSEDVIFNSKDMSTEAKVATVEGGCCILNIIYNIKAEKENISNCITKNTSNLSSLDRMVNVILKRAKFEVFKK